MRSRILVRGARQLVTLRGPSGPRRGAAMRELAVIPDGAVLIEDGIIAAVGPARQIENLADARNALEIGASGRVVMPGFVDSLTRLVPAAPPREDAGPADALRALSSGRLRGRVERTLSACFRHGTTTLEARTGCGLDASGTLKTLRVIASFRASPAEIIPTVLLAPGGEPESEPAACDLLAKIARRGLARFAGLACGEQAVPLEAARRLLEAALQAGFRLKADAACFGCDGLARMAVELGAASLDHLEQAGEQEADLLARSAAVATLLPANAFHLGLSRYPPARTLIDRGAAVALATGFDHGASPTCSMQAVMALACARMGMTPAEALSAATINGAHAIGAASRLGSLEYGKQADLIVLNAGDYREPAYALGENLVHMTIKRGEIVYEEGEVRWPED